MNVHNMKLYGEKLRRMRIEKEIFELILNIAKSHSCCLYERLDGIKNKTATPPFRCTAVLITTV